MSWPLGVILSCLAFLLFFLIGYWLGKRHGKELGLQEASAAIPLALREKFLEEGHCPLCGGQEANMSFENIDFSREILIYDK